MSELRANTISAADGTGPVNLTKQSAAKAWATWDASVSTPTIIDSTGVNSSITDNAAGDFTFSFTSAFENAGYTAGGVFAFGSDITNYVYSVRPKQSGSVTASSVRLITVYAGASAGIADHAYNNFVCHGDLA